MGGPDYIVDIPGLKSGPADAAGRQGANGSASGGGDGSSMEGRPWIAIYWKCCKAYGRVYRNRAATAYEGRCPKCLKAVKASVGEGGVESRFFNAE